MLFLKQIGLLILISLFWLFVLLAEKLLWIFYIPAAAVVAAAIYLLFFFGREDAGAQKAANAAQGRYAIAYNPALAELPNAVYLRPIPGDSLYGTCPNCSTKNEIGNRTCHLCGTPLKVTWEETKG